MKPTIKLPILALSILFTFAAAKRTDIQKTIAEQIVTTSDSVAIQKAIAEIRNFYVVFRAAVNEYKLDGSIGYDLLIDYFDFDRLWLPSVKFIPLDENQICYTKWKTPCTIEIKVIKQGKEYRIDNMVRRV